MREVDERMLRELAAEEKLLWHGAPLQGMRLRASDMVLVPFSLLWGGFAFFWEYGALHLSQRAGVYGAVSVGFFAVWGIPFVLLGIYLIFGRFLLDAYVRKRTLYALTNRRALIVTTLWSRQVKSITLRRLAELGLRERADGSGTITFGPSSAASWIYPAGWPGSGRKAATPAFELVENVRPVYDLIRQCQEAERAPTGR